MLCEYKHIMKNLIKNIILAALLFGFISAKSQLKNSKMENIKFELATFGGGCFWCTEAIFDQLKGVVSATSGYSGGTKTNPTYKEVCSGTTGHAEVIQVKFNPDEIGYFELLEIFFKTHNPTTYNKQGHDVGTQYRSVVFYHNTEQQTAAENIIKDLNDAKIWDNPIVTEISKYDTFYTAEGYHQEYFVNNPDNQYCKLVITPKVEKFEKLFKDKIKN